MISVIPQSSKELNQWRLNEIQSLIYTGQLIPVSDAVDLLGISKATIYSGIASETNPLDSLTVGETLYLTRRWLNNWRSKQRPAGRPRKQAKGE